MNGGLLHLAFRRALGGGFAWLFAALAWAATAASWAPTAEALVQWLAVDDPAAVARALTRRGVWSVLLLAVVPWAVFRSAAAVPRWRLGEIAWLASAPVSRARVVVSTAAGQALAALALVAAVFAVAELAAAHAGSELGATERPAEVVRLGGLLPVDTQVLDQHDHPLVVAIAPDARAAFVRAQVLPIVGRGAGPGGNTARVRMTLVRGTERSATVALVAARTELRTALPPGDGPLSLELERLGPGPVVALVGGSVETLERVGDERAAGASLALRALLALLAWQTLAFGLGAWMNAQLAALLSLSLAVLSLAAAGSRTWPGADLPRALALAGEGVIPARLGPGSAAGAALVVLVGLGLARAGLERWRGL